MDLNTIRQEKKDNAEFAGGLHLLTRDVLALVRPEKMEELCLKAASIILRQANDIDGLAAEVERARARTGEYSPRWDKS